jgi:hypothetical protein
MLFKTNRNGFKNPGTVLGPVRGYGLPQTVPGQPPGLRPAGSAHWPKRSTRPSRRTRSSNGGGISSHGARGGGHRARRSRAELTRVAARRGGGGGCFGRRRSTAAKQLLWRMTSIVWPCSAGEGGRRWGVSQFGRRESARSCSPMMAGDGGAWVGTREEEGCPVAGADEAVEKDGSSSSGVDAEQSGVRRRWLPQNGGRAGENMRGKWGGRLGAALRKGNGRERAPGTAVDSTGWRTRPTMDPSCQAWAAALLHKQGRAAARGRHGAARLTCGAGWRRGPVAGPGYAREIRARQHGAGALTGGPRPHSAEARFKLSFKPIQKYSNGSNEIRIPPNFGLFKRYLLALQKFQIKRGWKAFEVRNHFPYRNFSRFKKEFGLKFREVSMGWNQEKNHWKFLKLWNLVKFGRRAPCYTSCKEK